MIRGSKKKDRGNRRGAAPNAIGQLSNRRAINTSSGSAAVNSDDSNQTNRTNSILQSDSVDIFSDTFLESDDLIWPLHLVDYRDHEQFSILYNLLAKIPHAIMFYLNELIFPEVLSHQGLKLSTCGQELGMN
jgi:hypothetical protein